MRGETLLELTTEHHRLTWLLAARWAVECRAGSAACLMIALTTNGRHDGPSRAWRHIAALLAARVARPLGPRWDIACKQHLGGRSREPGSARLQRRLAVWEQGEPAVKLGPPNLVHQPKGAAVSPWPNMASGAPLGPGGTLSGPGRRGQEVRTAVTDGLQHRACCPWLAIQLFCLSDRKGACNTKCLKAGRRRQFRGGSGVGVVGRMLPQQLAHAAHTQAEQDAQAEAKASPGSLFSESPHRHGCQGPCHQGPCHQDPCHQGPCRRGLRVRDSGSKAGAAEAAELA